MSTGHDYETAYYNKSTLNWSLDKDTQLILRSCLQGCNRWFTPARLCFQIRKRLVQVSHSLLSAVWHDLRRHFKVWMWTFLLSMLLHSLTWAEGDEGNLAQPKFNQWNNLCTQRLNCHLDEVYSCHHQWQYHIWFLWSAWRFFS